MPDNNACLPHFPSIRNDFTLQNKKQQDCALGASFSSSSHIFPIPSDFLSLERGKKLPDHTFIARQFWLSPENAPPEMLPRWQAALLANTGPPRTGVASHILIIPCVWGRPHINTSGSPEPQQMWACWAHLARKYGAEQPQHAHS